MKQSTLQDQEALLELLQLCNSHVEDEFGNDRYEFTTESVKAVLDYSRNDGDASIALFVHEQEESVVEVNLLGSEDVKVVNEIHGAYIEFAGQIRDEEFSRGNMRKTFGFRLWIKPTLRIEPYYIGDTEGR